MKKLYFVMVILVCGVLVWACLASGSGLGAFISVPSLIAVVLPGLFMSIAHFSFTEMGTFFKISFKEEAAEPGLKKALLFFTSLQSYTILAGVFATLAGVIGMLGNIEDKSSIGSGMSLALITILYAVILNLTLIVPFKTAIRKQLSAK